MQIVVSAGAALGQTLIVNVPPAAPSAEIPLTAPAYDFELDE
jgi:hypothetical protein